VSGVAAHHEAIIAVAPLSHFSPYAVRVSHLTGRATRYDDSALPDLAYGH